MSVRIIERLSEVAAGFDALLLDMWGVLHDGFEAYPGAVEALRAMRQTGKKILLLSNSPRRAEPLRDMMSGFGIGHDLYDHILSSGEAVHQDLARRTDPFFAGLGRNLYHLGPERDIGTYQGLDLAAVGIDHADFILNTGPWGVDDTVEDYLPVLRRGIERRLPMVCANPDLVVMVQGKPMICAGAVAARYAEMGGRVAYRGKPDPAIYALALDLLGAEPERVLAVGDALHTDIAGANAAGLRAVFVTQGIHAADLGISPGACPTAEHLRQLYARHGQIPLAAMPTLLW